MYWNVCLYEREGAFNNTPQPPHLLVLYRMSSISTTWATKTTNPNLIGLFQNMIPAPPEQVQLQTLLCGSWIGRCFAQPYFHTMDTWGRSGRKKQLIPKPLSLTGAVAFDVICFISFTSPPAHQLSTIAFLKASPQPSKSNESPVQVSVVVSCHISFLSPARRPLVHWVKIPPAIWSTNSPLTNSVVDDDDVIFWENCHNNYRDCPVAQVWSNCLVTGGMEPAWRNSPFARQWSGPIHGRLASNKLVMMVMTMMMMMMIIIWANMWFPNHTTSANLPFSPHLSDNWSTCGVCFLGITS